VSILAGALALIALEALVSGQGPENASGIVGFVDKVVRWFVDPTVPGIPNLSGDTGQPSTTAAAAYSSSGPAVSTVLTSDVSAASAAASNPNVTIELLAAGPAGSTPALAGVNTDTTAPGEAPLGSGTYAT
jgi:hypothetical protein